MDAFPIEAGEIHPDDRVLPQLSGVSLFSRTEVYRVADKRRAEISDYCNRLMTLKPKISQFPTLLDFLELRDDDLNIPDNSTEKKSTSLLSLGKKIKKKKKDRVSSDADEFEITNPLQLQTYTAIAPYKAVGKGQINLQLDDQADVIDKNENGWWFVSCSGVEGWAPATYLDCVTAVDSVTDELPCLAGELFLTIKEYTAQLEDELSFDRLVVVEVMNKILDGWWIASYDGKVGYVPSTYLQVYNNKYLKPIETRSLPAEFANSPIPPTPRRQSIKTPTTKPQKPKRDLQPYRRASEKRRQRSIKQQNPLQTDVVMPLSWVLEADDDEKNDTYLSPSSLGTLSSNASTATYIDPNSYSLHTRGVNLSPPPPPQITAVGIFHESHSVAKQLKAGGKVATQSTLNGDSDLYEPILAHDYDIPRNTPIKASNKSEMVDVLPNYQAPPPPPVKPRRTPAADLPAVTPRNKTATTSDKDTAKSKLNLNTTVPAASSASLSPDGYEIVCNKLPTSNGGSKAADSKTQPRNATRLPPPKPADSQLTQLSSEDSADYAYVPLTGIVSPLPQTVKSPPSHFTKTVPTSLAESNLALKPARGQPLSAAKPAPTTRALPGFAHTKPPKLSNTQTSPSGPTSANKVFGSNQTNKQKPVGVDKTPDLVTLNITREDNNNSSLDEEGKIYEEVLIKPSQVKGLKSALIRKPK